MAARKQHQYVWRLKHRQHYGGKQRGKRNGVAKIAYQPAACGKRKQKRRIVARRRRQHLQQRRRSVAKSTLAFSLRLQPRHLSQHQRKCWHRRSGSVAFTANAFFLIIPGRAIVIKRRRKMASAMPKRRKRRVRETQHQKAWRNQSVSK